MAATALRSREVVVGPGAARSRRVRSRRCAASGARAGSSLAGPLLLLGVWELATTVGGVAPQTLASPATVASTAWDLTRERRAPRRAARVPAPRRDRPAARRLRRAPRWRSCPACSRVGERLIDPLVQMFRTMPALALVPLFILWFGIDERPKVLLVAFAVAFPIYVNLYGGIRGVDARLVEAGRVFGLGRWGLIRHVVLPGRCRRGSSACASRSGSRGSCSSRRSRSTRPPASARS